MWKGLTGAVLAAVLSLAGIHSAAQSAPGQTAYDFSFTAIDGSPMPLSRFKGNVLLVVNTASKCGFVGQYDGLEMLWNAYKDRGLVVIGVPSNDFGGQEPGSREEIADFCRLNYGVSFPLTDKTAVSGDNAHPFYKWAGDEAGLVGRPKWNFHKYLIGSDGRFLDWFATTTDPQSEKLIKTIEAALAEPKQEMPAH
ncbi:glutathione peroxidase [Rhodoligotrophos defluvii]|uniref:glutathione peroxidase n=1 Tax=Rhodoligotrophos defluvii TaxID=2561934 RepID=UPI0010C9E4F6|nr:glutathione peroxidase [Rhodoligotrophos defluvii]